VIGDEVAIGVQGISREQASEHGLLYELPDHFAKHVETFLDS
jgi:hypothetical protein